jgi:hypothetical protein
MEGFKFDNMIIVIIEKTFLCNQIFALDITSKHIYFGANGVSMF